jgi:hypothetical protein
VRIEINYCFFYLAIHHFEVHFEAQGGGQFEALDVVADIKAAND